MLQAEACNTDTTPTQPHRISNTRRTKNNTTNVVLQQNSRKLLMMGVLMSETCWAHKKWNKLASDIKLVFYSSTITMTHGPINIRCRVSLQNKINLRHWCIWLVLLWKFLLQLSSVQCCISDFSSYISYSRARFLYRLFQSYWFYLFRTIDLFFT